MISCIFCDIVDGKAEAQIIFENDLVCCFLDKYPINPGHVLIVPKTHVPEFVDVDPESLTAVIMAAQEITRAMEAALKTDGITVFQEGGAFKDVDHYHMHIVPRFKGDGFSWVEPEINANAIDFNSLKAKIKEALSGNAAER